MSFRVEFYTISHSYDHDGIMSRPPLLHFQTHTTGKSYSQDLNPNVLALKFQSRAEPIMSLQNRSTLACGILG